MKYSKISLASSMILSLNATASIFPGDKDKDSLSENQRKAYAACVSNAGKAVLDSMKAADPQSTTTFFVNALESELNPSNGLSGNLGQRLSELCENAVKETLFN